jgi:hypothetical protein
VEPGRKTKVREWETKGQGDLEKRRNNLEVSITLYRYTPKKT